MPTQRRGAGRAKARILSSSSSGSQPVNRADLAIRPPTHNIPTSVPKQLANKIAWDTVKVTGFITVSSSVVVETNFSYNLGFHPQAGSWTSLYDQWCIPQVTITLNSQYPSNATFAPVQLVTALDFDNTTNVSTIGALMDYSTAAQKTMGVEAVVTRSIKPCVKPQLSTTSSSGLDRIWVDSAVPSTPWYGLRTMVNSGGGSYLISYTHTIWFAFRNQI